MHLSLFFDYSKADELRSEERRTRIRLGESLQTLWPTMSVKGKQSAAEATPTVYDIVRILLFLIVSSYLSFTSLV